MNNQTLGIPTLHGALRGDRTAVTQIRYNFLQLQALVAVVLSYQVLFTEHGLYPAFAQLPTVLGLLLSCALLMVIPDRWIWAPWFPGALALGDTAIVTGLIYLSGNVSSDLYLAYFVILLIATMCRTPQQMFLFFSAVCLLYSLVLYREIQATGHVFEQHLLRVPLLLVMAIFYGRTMESLRILAEYDPLTGLPNRRTFLALVADAVAQAQATHDSTALFLLNLDGFKLINDTLGRRTGDQLLVEVATRLTEGPGRGRRVARESGDEFALLVERLSSPQECARLAEDILRTMESPFAVADRELFITTRIGIALCPQDAEDAEGLLKNADAALSRAKAQGTNTYQYYSAEINAQAYRKLEMAHSLRKAVERQEFRVLYQPQIELPTSNIVGVEALVRWQHPDLGLISPHQFIALAEDTGLIVPIGQWILREACRQVKAWDSTAGQPLRVGVNLSIRQLSELHLIPLIAQALGETGLDPRYLEVELTESLLLQDKEKTVNVLRSLKTLGIRLAIDDFGTGYSALSYLQRFPIDTLKIDQSFIRGVTINPEAQAIVKAIIGMARALDLKVVAEGVEHEPQADFLRAEGCDECQGYLYSRPLSAGDMVEFLARWQTPSRNLVL